MDKIIELQDLYNNAILFAAEYHGSQKMPNGFPYIVHLSNVAMEVLLAHQKEPSFCLQTAIQIALLHDVLEDTNATFDTLNARFGSNVSKSVMSLTKDKRLPKELQMKDSINRILKSTKEASIVKICDRITNLQSPPSNWSFDKKQNYLKEAQNIAQNLKNTHKFLETRLSDKIENYFYTQISR